MRNVASRRDDVPRPATLDEVAVRALRGEPFDPLLREFLDTFYGSNSDMMGCAISAAPARIDPVHDAYLAAVVEHLAAVPAACPAMG